MQLNKKCKHTPSAANDSQWDQIVADNSLTVVFFLNDNDRRIETTNKQTRVKRTGPSNYVNGSDLLTVLKSRAHNWNVVEAGHNSQCFATYKSKKINK